MNPREFIFTYYHNFYNLYKYDFNGNICSLNTNFRWQNYNIYELDVYLRDILANYFKPNHIIIVINDK